MKKEYIRLKIVICSIVLSMLCPVYAVNLFQTYQKALSYNADYLKAIAANQAGIEQQNIALAALLPQLSAAESISENYFSQTGIYAYYHQPYYSAQLNQVVFDFSKFSTYVKGKYAAELADLQLANAKQQLMVNTAQAYFDVLYAEDTLLATQMTKKAFEKQMNQAKVAFEAGTVTIADVNDAKAALDTALAQEIRDQNNLINKKNIFRNLTGINPDQVQPLLTDIDLKLPKPTNIEEWAQIAKSSNLNIRIANAQLAMAEEDISIAKAGHMPTINFNIQYNYQDIGSLDTTNAPPQVIQPILTVPGSVLSNYGTVSAGLQINIPLLAGGGINAGVRQAIANFESSEEQLVGIERQTDQDVRNAYWQVQNGVSIVLAQKAALKSAKIKLDSDQLGYQVGIRNSVDLVNSQKSYYQTFQSYQQSRYQYLMAEAQLKYLSGIIDDTFLQYLNSNIKN